MPQIVKKGVPLKQQIDQTLEVGGESWEKVAAVTTGKAGRTNTMGPADGLAFLQAVDKGQIEQGVTVIWVSTRNANVKITAADGGPLASASEWHLTGDYVQTGRIVVT